LARFYDVGYQDGYTHGQKHGLIEGRTLGKEKGYEMWEEVGFYLGSARTFVALLKVGFWAEGFVIFVRHP
jgi:predicted transposase YdaD